MIYFNDELCNADRKYLSKSAKFLQSAQKSATNKTITSINISSNAVKEMLFTQTYYHGNVKDTELVNLSISNTFLPNLISVVSCLEIWKYIRVISHKITI